MPGRSLRLDLAGRFRRLSSLARVIVGDVAAPRGRRSGRLDVPSDHGTSTVAAGVVVVSTRPTPAPERFDNDQDELRALILSVRDELMRRADDIEAAIHELRAEIGSRVPVDAHAPATEAASVPEPAPTTSSPEAPPPAPSSLSPAYGDLVDEIRATVQRLIAPDGVVLVVSKGDEALLDLPGRVGWHFPQTADGLYAGHYPADSVEAITHLELLRIRGAQYFVLPNTSYWWLDHYRALRQHLEERYRLMWSDGQCMIYQLSTVV